MEAWGLGAAIRRERTRRGLSRSMLAAEAELSVNTLMKVEQGQTLDPGVFKVAKLCRALSVSLDELVRSAQQVTSQKEAMKMSHGIVSVGYEGRTIDDMVAALAKMGVTTVADVRLNAISRKPGFSKSRLRDALEGVGIEYRHMRGLGNAKDNREPFWTGRVQEGREVFRSTLQGEVASANLQELTQLAQDQVVAVLCFEADQEMCHRQVVIDEITDSIAVPVVPLPAQAPRSG